MECLSFEKLPHYIFSANRQFVRGEKHMNRTFNESVIVLVRKGVLRFREANVNVEVKEGEYYIQKAGLKQEGVEPSDEPNYFFIHFKGYYTQNGLPLRGTFHIEEAQKIITEMEKLGNTAEKLDYDSLFYLLLRQLRREMYRETPAERIRTYLINRYNENITIDDLMKLIYRSQNQVINIFKAAYSTTPYHFLVDFRLLKAAELLIATDIPVKDVGFKVGFVEYTSFYKAFEKKYLKSPIEYRKTHLINSFPKGIYFDPLITH